MKTFGQDLRGNDNIGFMKPSYKLNPWDFKSNPLLFSWLVCWPKAYQPTNLPRFVLLFVFEYKNKKQKTKKSETQGPRQDRIKTLFASYLSAANLYNLYSLKVDPPKGGVEMHHVRLLKVKVS